MQIMRPVSYREEARPRKVSPQTDISAWYLDASVTQTREISDASRALRELSMPKKRFKDRAGSGVRQADYS